MIGWILGWYATDVFGNGRQLFPLPTRGQVKGVAFVLGLDRSFLLGAVAHPRGMASAAQPPSSILFLVAEKTRWLERSLLMQVISSSGIDG
jgi:hypothetical protein